MKTKIVIWGSDNNDQKLLLALQLLEDENKVAIYKFPEHIATEEFYNKMMNIWRFSGELPFPEGHETIYRELNMTDGLLPDELKTDRTDIINRAKTEWHFVVLSNKLSTAFKDELVDMKERIEPLTEFDPAIWEEMKGFWTKVQGQVREKNLFKEHAIELKKMTNELFDKMKSIKNTMNEEFEKVSSQNMDNFIKKVEVIEEKITKGLGLQPIFNELKDLQSQFNATDFTRKDRSKVWKKIDKAFKFLKEKKYGGDRNQDDSNLSRIKRRHDGLLTAIQKMETSIQRDKNEMEFQQGRINTTHGQLESQLRQAKLNMIGERIRSKEEKLVEMFKTKSDLEKRISIEQEREAKKKEKEQIKTEKKEVKAKIAQQIKDAQTDIEDTEKQKLEKAAAAIADSTVNDTDKELNKLNSTEEE